MKTYYECTFIVNPGLDDAQIETTAKAVEETIVKNGGEMVNTDHIGRRRLAYPIAKKHNGYYICMEFEMDGRSLERVERLLKLDENVMRHLTLKLDKRDLEAKQRRAALAAAPPIENVPASVTAAAVAAAAAAEAAAAEAAAGTEAEKSAQSAGDSEA